MNLCAYFQLRIIDNWPLYTYCAIIWIKVVCFLSYFRTNMFELINFLVYKKYFNNNLPLLNLLKNFFSFFLLHLFSGKIHISVMSLYLLPMVSFEILIGQTSLSMLFSSSNNPLVIVLLNPVLYVVAFLFLSQSFQIDAVHPLTFRVLIISSIYI